VGLKKKLQKDQEKKLEIKTIKTTLEKTIPSV
jgi:hypothetical protein